MPVTSWYIPVKMHPQIPFTFLLCLCTVHAGDTVQMLRNPGCEPPCPASKDKLDVLYIRSWDQNSSVHFLFWATGNVTPSVLALHSSNPMAQVSIDWKTAVSKWPKTEKVISLENVTQSYALAFLSLIDLRLGLTPDHQGSTPTLDRSPGTFHPHYFDKCNWELTNQSSGKRDEFWATYSAKLLSSTQESIVQLKFRLRADHRSLDLEVSLSNLQSQYPNGQFGLEVVLLSNMSVVNNDDYLLTQQSMDAGRLYTVYLDHRINSPASLTNTASQPKGFFQSNSTCHRKPTNSCEVTLDVWRQKLTQSQKKHYTKTLSSLFYGERLNQQYAGLDSMADVNQRWAHVKHLPPVGLRTQGIYFQSPLTGSDHIVWYGSFGFTTEPQQGIPLTARPNVFKPASIGTQSAEMSVRHQSHSTSVHQSEMSTMRWLQCLAGLAIVCSIVSCVILLRVLTKHRTCVCGQKPSHFLSLNGPLEPAVAINL